MEVVSLDMRRLRRGRRLLSSDAPFASKNTTGNPCVENAHPAVIGRQRVASSSRRQWKVTRVHTACQTNTPVDALDTLVERNAATRHMAQFVTAVVVRRPSSPVRCNFSWTAVVSALWLFFQSRRCVAFRHKNSLSIVVSGPILDSTFPRFSGNAYQHCHIPVHDGC